MQWINLVPEDAGIQNLKADNRRPVIANNVDAVPPYPSVQSPHTGKGADRSAQQRRERRSSERRTGADRRQQQVTVLLDTRAKHDRRVIGNRRSKPSSDHDQTPHKVYLNLYA